MEFGGTSFRWTVSTVVAAEPRLVERFLLDPGCHATWQHGVSGRIRATTPVLQTGTAVEMMGRIGPLRLPYTTIVSEHVPGRKLVLRTTHGIVDLLIEFRWIGAGGGTRVDVSVEGRSTQAKAWVVPLVEAASRRNTRRNLAGLKRTLESGEFEFTVPSTLTGDPPHCTQDPPPDFL